MDRMGTYRVGYSTISFWDDEVLGMVTQKARQRLVDNIIPTFGGSLVLVDFVANLTRGHNTTPRPSDYLPAGQCTL